MPDRRVAELVAAVAARRAAVALRSAVEWEPVAAECRWAVALQPGVEAG